MRKIREYGEVQRYLEQLGHIQLNIKGKQMQIEQLQEQATSITTMLKMDKVKGGSLNGGFADAVAKIVDLQFAINTEIYKLVKTTAEINLRLDNMYLDHPVATNLLTMRYVNRLNWEDVCVQMHCSLATVHRLHGQALKKFKNYMSQCKDDI